jgi:hypothetical protein
MSWPTTVLDWALLITTLLAIISAFVGFCAGVYRLGSRNALKSIRQTNLVNRYENIYAPMSCLFLTRPVTSVRGVLAFYWQQRWANAKKLLKKGKLLPAFTALFDKKATKETAEFEYGHIFPMKEILQILEGNEAYADERLLDLITQVERSKYDENVQEIDEQILTDEEFALYRHIVQTHERLQHLFAPN